LTVPARRDSRQFVHFTNISEDDMTLMHLAKQGYASLPELWEMDTPEVLDLIEYENIQADIQEYLEWEARNDG